jgi:hypothetical protein
VETLFFQLELELELEAEADVADDNGLASS